jgi:phospholipid/cholesterol/gamma-HCH transport system permease protein
MIQKIIDFLGIFVLEKCSLIGRFFIFFVHFLISLFKRRLKLRQLFLQMERVGIGSFAIVFITGAFTGMVLALQTYIGFKRFGAEGFIGTIVSLSIIRELGPVLTGLMVTARSGSAMAAEIGTMNITEQIDALRTLCIDPYQYLIVPRIIASALVMPFLALYSMLFGIGGGYLFYVYILGLNAESYTSGIREVIILSDITGGLIKASFFGLIFSWVGTYNGYHTRGGAQGVGAATTQSVVMGSILILICNYFLSALLFQSENL